MRKVTRRTVLRGVGAIALTPLFVKAAFAKDEFTGRTVVSSGQGGGTQDNIAAAVYSPFEVETKAKVTLVPMLSAAGLARMKAEATNPQIDMYHYSGGQEVEAKKLGLTQPLTGAAASANILPGLRDADRNWVAWAVVAEGILYRTDKISEPPKSYKDFFKPEYKGHIAFPAITNGFGMDFLIMLARTFGGSESNIDPGFQALKKIKGETIFGGASDVATLFSQGDTWIMPYDASTGFQAQQTGLPIAFAKPAEGSPAVFITTCVSKGAKNTDVANALIDRLIRPDSQVEIARRLRWAPTNADTKLPADLAAQLPSPKELVQLDRGLINQKRSEWTERWNREIAG